ncbi:MAG TPA: hypothetical protein VJB16_03635, partial [archaeon]|nr:hypothetical protein [archaeon]
SVHSPAPTASSAAAAAAASVHRRGMDTVHQRLSELELALFNCRQEAQVEQVLLRPHPVVAKQARDAAAHGAALRAADFPEELLTPAFLNELQSCAMGWARDISRVTQHEKIEKMPAMGDVGSEVKFWQELHAELQHIQEQLKAPAAVVTLGILRQAKRFVASAAFDGDSLGLHRCTELVSGYLPLVQNFPIAGLQSAQSFDALREAVSAVFAHLKSRSSSSYPVARSLQLLNALSREILERAATVTHSRRPMAFKYADFVAFQQSFDEFMNILEQSVASFVDSLRETAKKRDEIVVMVVKTDFGAFREHIKSFFVFRKQHEELLEVLDRVVASSGGGSGGGAADATHPRRIIVDAYSLIADVDVADLTE